jgi:DNA-binding TFAR19-related protein (PDSD5 family)
LSAPKAVSQTRIIDLTEPGRWSDEQEKLAIAALNAVAPSKDEIFDQILADEAVDRLNESKVVNE